MYKLLVCFLLIGRATLIDITYYEILGVSKQSTVQEIKQAYKKLAVKYHPDKNPDADKQEHFLKITEAYETLKDSEKRRNYDLYGSNNAFTKKYDYRTQSEYDNLYYNGLYHGDPFVDTLSPKTYYNYLSEGFYFINYYSPFCPPCQNLVDHWKKLAKVYKGIVKIGAVNCKYYNNFCYNSMRISSYPSLLFYPNGKHGSYNYYRGDRTYEALDQFIMNYLNSKVHIPVVNQIKKTDHPIAYVLGDNMIDKTILTRIAYQLKNLVTVVKVEDDDLRYKLTKDDSVTVVFKYRDIVKEIVSTEEEEIVKIVVNTLPTTETVNPEKLKKIRNELRAGHAVPWVLYFRSEKDDRLTLHQLRNAFPDFHFGEINCNKWNDLCVSLQVEDTPAWAVLKSGGGYQKAPNNADLRSFIRTAVETTRLHSLSSSEFTRILYGDDFGTWVLLVVPYLLSYENFAEPFAKTSLRFLHTDRINFGIMACTQTTDKYCRQIAYNQPVIIVQNGTKRFTFNGQVEENQLTEFIELIKESPDLEIDEKQVLEILDPSSREKTWLVAFLPSNCGELCDDLMYELLVVADKLRPLDFVKVGVLRCSNRAAFCSNIRTATARLYPIASGQHYSISLQQVSQAPYILEWAMERIDDSVQKLSWHIFSKNVIAEELHPTGDKKPWLIYFHSPRCYRCYEMYSEFAIAGIYLNNAVNLGKVNCLNERSLCQNEHITSYPSLKLYLSRNQRQQFSSTINIQVGDYKSILDEIKKHLAKYDKKLVQQVSNSGAKFMSHDEL